MARGFKEQDARAFLRQRGLTKAFNRFRAIRKYPKRTIEIDRDGIRRKLLVYKRNKRLVIADFFTLKTQATTSKYNLSNIRAALAQSVTKQKKSIGAPLRTPLISLKNHRTTPLKNTDLLELNKPLRGKVGRLFINVTFKKGEIKQTVEGGSRGSRALNITSEFRKAFDEAFTGALSQLKFYNWDAYKVNWIHYAYFTPKSKLRL